jgi:hypothetical protein
MEVRLNFPDSDFILNVVAKMKTNPYEPRWPSTEAKKSLKIIVPGAFAFGGCIGVAVLLVVPFFPRNHRCWIQEFLLLLSEKSILALLTIILFGVLCNAAYLGSAAVYRCLRNDESKP